MTEVDLPPVESPWNARDLGAVCFVTLGVWLVINGLWSIAYLVQSSAGVQEFFADLPWSSVGLHLIIGAALFLGGRRLAAVMLPRGHGSEPPPVVPLLSGAIALLGIGFALGQVDALIRVTVPFLVYDQNEEIPWRWPVVDLASVGLGLLVFARAGAIARLWERWNERK